ncbi:MAG: TIGR02996 domain-containing protein [Myxococcaceae bacterium]|nr:TIGR02996 domain-containing protein [Myxococcaceae bacterium]
MTTPPSPPIGSTPFTLRSWSLEHEVRPLFQRVFDERPQVRSLLLCVAQYWADEADDAVHGHLVLSARDVPRWPHRCADDEHPGDGDLCTYCCARDFNDPRARWVSWDDNGLAIRCWQAFCHEGANQEEDPNHTSVPVVLGRRHEGGVALDFVGRALRPWLDLPTTGLPTWFLQEEASTPLEPVVVTPRPRDEAPFRDAIAAAPFDDGPRLVFADWLQQRGDPLGEFISLSLARPRSEAASMRRRALVQEHAEAWLGELVSCVSPGSADFSRGLLTGASVCFDERTEALASSPAWATVEHLDFAEMSRVTFSTAMTALTSVSGLRREGLHALPPTVTHVACRPEVVLAGLPPQVKALTVAVPFAASAREPLRALLERPELTRLERLSIGLEPTLDDDASPPWELAREVLTWARADVVSIGGWSAGHRRSGWWLECREGVARLSLEGLSTFQSSEARAGLLRALREWGDGPTSVLPAVRVVAVANQLWKPSAEEQASLGRAGVPVEFEGPPPAPEPAPLPPPERPPPRPLPLVVDPISRAVSLPVDATARPVSQKPVRPFTRWFELVLLVAAAAALVVRACASA